MAEVNSKGPQQEEKHLKLGAGIFISQEKNLPLHWDLPG